MFEEYDGDDHLVIICEGQEVVYQNGAAASFFCRGGSGEDSEDLNTVISEVCLKKYSEESAGGDEFSARLTLFNNIETDFTIKEIEKEGKKYLLLRSLYCEKACEEALSQYNDIRYEGDDDNCLEVILSDLNYLKKSAAVRRNNDLYFKISEIEGLVGRLFKGEAKKANEVDNANENYVSNKTDFDVCELLEKITDGIEKQLLIDNYNIAVSREIFDSGFICADYRRISEAFTVLISNSVKYVVASGRKGRITVSSKKTDEGEIVISIRDNGI